MSNLPVELLTTDELRRVEGAAIASGISGYTLMTRAGTAAAKRLRARWPNARTIAVWCGTGNNGGDGYVIARVLAESGLNIQILQVGDAAKITGDALMARNAAIAAGLIVASYNDATKVVADVHVDALLGIGLSGHLSDTARSAIRAMNASGCPVLSVDIPSGLHADTGAKWGYAVHATLTITFIGLKRGLFTGEASAHCGEIVLDDLDLPSDCYHGIAARCERIVNDHWCSTRRASTAHKGHFGHVLVCGGAPGLGGAATLAARAALRSGAGWVSVATHPSHAVHMFALQPELMCHGVSAPVELSALIDRATVVAVGPGLGLSAWGLSLWLKIAEKPLPMVVDADALNLLAQNPLQRDDWVLTPHPGEAARLLKMDVADVQRDRFSAVYAIQEAYGGVCVLKGVGTLVCGADKHVHVCDAGNPGMASAGMGDVLTGVIAGLIAQRKPTGDSLRDIVAQAVHIHSTAGDRAAGTAGERGLIASDVIAQLRAVVNDRIPA